MKAVALVFLLAQASSGEILDDERYRFCHDDRYPMWEDERAWCDLVGEKSARCPELPQACKAGIEAEGELGQGEGEKRRGPGDGDARKAKEKPPEMQVPTAMSGLAQIIFIVLLALGLMALLWALFRDRFSDRTPDEPEEAGPADESAPVEEPPRVVLTDVERLLAEARRAAEGGRYEKAIELAYAAALRRLDGDGLIDMHHSRTNGDYVRSLRAQPELASHMRALVRDVERVQFGAAEASPTLFDSVLSRVLPVATRVATLVLFVLAMGCQEGEAEDDPVAGGFSPSGTRAIVAHVERGGQTIDYRLARLDKVAESTAVLFILPGGGPEDGDWSGVKEWVDLGGLLVLAGERPDDPELAVEIGPWVEETAITPTAGWSWDLEDLDLRIPPGPSLKPKIGGEDAVATLTRGTGPDAPIYALEQSRGAGLIIATADASLFTNVAMAVGDNPEAAAFVLEPLRAGKIEVCNILTGAGAETPMESIHRAKLTPFILQLLAFLALFMLYRGRAFGTLRDPETQRRRAFADHVRALGMQYARARAAGRAAGAYSHWAIEQLRERIPRGRHRDLDEVAAEAAARAGEPPAEVAELLRAAQITSDTEGPPSTARRPGLTGEVPFANEAERIHIVRRLARLLAATGHRRRDG